MIARSVDKCSMHFVVFRSNSMSYLRGTCSLTELIRGFNFFVKVTGHKFKVCWWHFSAATINKETDSNIANSKSILGQRVWQACVTSSMPTSAIIYNAYTSIKKKKKIHKY